MSQAVVEGWGQQHGRPLSATEQYAAVKLALFQAFDDRVELGEVEVEGAGLEAYLAGLEID